MSSSELKKMALIALGLVILPMVLDAGGLTYSTAVDCLVLALAGLALNILLGYTGLVSFGHGAWFGIGAYAMGIFQLRFFPQSTLVPLVAAVALVAVVALLVGLLILRRRGVYFSLLTLAFGALCFAVAYRWTALTGGENGLGGIERRAVFGIDLDASVNFYIFVALIAFVVIGFLLRLTQSPFGHVLTAIRENEVRTRFVGFDVDSYKLLAFVLSAAITGLAGGLSVLGHRIASAETMSLAFSGELLAIVLIGGMRSFTGPIFGALFYILFREYLSMYTANWLLYFGLVFIFFILVTPSGLTGVWQRLVRLVIPEKTTGAAMGQRVMPADPDFFPSFLTGRDAAALACVGISKHFGGIKAVDDVNLNVAGKGVHALIGPNGAGKTSLFNLISGMFPADQGSLALDSASLNGLGPDRICASGLARSFQITNLFKGLTVRENLCLSVLSRDPHRFSIWRRLDALPDTQSQTEELVRYLGVQGMEGARAEDLSYGGQRVVDMGLALGAAPRILLLDEPLAGLAAAERDRIGRLIRKLGDRIGILLVEHDVDRVFAMADTITVMNQGSVLVEGDAQRVRSDPQVREIYIGSGSEALAAKVQPAALQDDVALRVRNLDAYYGKSHILSDISFEARKGEVIAVLGRNGAGKSTLLKTLLGLARMGAGSIDIAGKSMASPIPEAMARLGIAFVPQGRRLFSGLTVKDNLMLGRLKRSEKGSNGWPDEEIFKIFPRLKERYNVDATLLSGGEQQMVAIARALVGHVEVLLLDEPFEGLSPAMIEEVFNAILALKARMTILIVDHNLDLALALSDTVLVLDRGKVAHQGEARELLVNLEFRQEKLWV
ncbi:branched-chain amino acid ABC transporter ATP-binding protein/permease [Pusillimonas sp. SM2304]|uniref:branched-chain amino acid ABC transporter ATP-binding protein/permease n=1 Tax=Pusillimonas sp. SM2304 TaxID=3073241 RepID=UPI0028754AFB|nr:branched-chain amino acid ABC transporter ATP-binding protein/permease [Pusillimonas sp. SM2304]MDS1142204.1 branched-chain amino acid ABC transporter ATP-binding protein/permease [Pusillimonas sp. SM2304]